MKLTRGTKLIRAQAEQDPTIQFQVCEDTAKTGCYLTNSPILAFGAVNEKKHLSDTFYIHTYLVTRDIYFSFGKYQYRQLSPERYFNQDSSLIPNIEVLPFENESHCDYVLPILDFDEDYDVEHLEFFITKEKQRASLQYIRTDEVDSATVPEIFRSNFKDYEQLLNL